MKVPVVLSIKIVKDLDLRISIEVGSKLRGEDLCQNVVNFLSHGSSVEIVQKSLSLARSTLMVSHGNFLY